MFRQPTVFIVGAGCSYELGFPLGYGLLKEIDQRFRRHESQRYEAIQAAFATSPVPNANVDLRERARLFLDGLLAAPTIDQYLHFHRDDPAMVMLGKCAIAGEILNAEASSSLSVEHFEQPLPECWLRSLFHLFAVEIDRSGISELFSNVSFVCFNYDRSIELFFLRATMSLAHCTYEEALGAVAKLKIWHPYGVVGDYKLNSPGISYKALAFTEHLVGAPTVLEAASRLRTFTEGIEDSEALEEARQWMKAARNIVYLGFGFLQENMTLLRLPDAGANPQWVTGTSLGLSASDLDIARSAITVSLNGRYPHQLADAVQLFPVKASTFLKDFGRKLCL